MPTTLFPEQTARQHIDQQLVQSGWTVQDMDEMNLTLPAIAVREFHLKTGFADYLLFVDGQAIGAVEAKKAGTTLIGVEPQSKKYSEGLPDFVPSWVAPPSPPQSPPLGGIKGGRRVLPFLYESTGIETRFTNTLDPKPRSRRVFTFHRPEMLRLWASRLPTFRHNLRENMPSLVTQGLWQPQIEAITHLEQSLADDRPRALIQMATGSGKTFTAVSAIYRLIKFGGARRVLFLVDRSNLGRQAHNEFQQYTPPDDGRKFTQIYNVRHLTSNAIDPDDTVYITTIQRLYAILRGEPLDPTLEEQAMDEIAGEFGRQPKTVARQILQGF